MEHGFGESSLDAKDSLAKGFLRYREGPSNFGGHEAANQTQRKSDAPSNCEDRLAGGKDYAEGRQAHLMLEESHL